MESPVGTRAAIAQKTENKVVPFASAIHVQIQSSVTKWHDELSFKDSKRLKKWKQILKKKFVKLTQLACASPAAQKKIWRKDLEKAGIETIALLCPDWQNNPEHRAMYELILKEMNPKKCPRRDWLRETACMWLESLPGEFQNADWYPEKAVRVAHEIFLRGSTKFRTFIKNIRTRKSPIILKLIEDWEDTQVVIDLCGLADDSSFLSGDEMIDSIDINGLTNSGASGMNSTVLAAATNQMQETKITDLKKKLAAAEKRLKAQDETHKIALATVRSAVVSAETKATNAEARAESLRNECNSLMTTAIELEEDLKARERETEVLRQRVQQHERVKSSKSDLSATFPDWVDTLKKQNQDLVQEMKALQSELSREKTKKKEMLESIKDFEHLLIKAEENEKSLKEEKDYLKNENAMLERENKQKDICIQELRTKIKTQDKLIEKLGRETSERWRHDNGMAISGSNDIDIDALSSISDSETTYCFDPAMEERLREARLERQNQNNPSLEAEMNACSAAHDKSTTCTDAPVPLPEASVTRVPVVPFDAGAQHRQIDAAINPSLLTDCHTQRKRRAAPAASAALGPDFDDQPPEAKRIARTASAVSEIRRELHWMCATMHNDTSAETEHNVSMTTPMLQVPEARSVVVLYVRFTTGEVRRSHGFCIDSKQGIVVGGAHTLPRKLSDLAVIDVHLYQRMKRRFEPCFIAKPLAGGVSTAFQHGGMDLALLRITHLYVDATTSGSVAVVTPADIERRLSGIRIGTSGYEPRDPVSIIRFPIIEADNSRGCKSKCGRVMACEDSRLHLDFTELQDGDSGSLVINGAGEALGFLMGRAPDQNCEQCRCLQPVNIPNNSVYYAQLLNAEEPQAFIQNALQWSRLKSNFSTADPVPWGEYKIKQRIRKLEQTRGLKEPEKQQVVELVALFQKALKSHRTKSQEEQKQLFEAAQSKAKDAIEKLESVRQAVIMQCQTKLEKEREDSNAIKLAANQIKMEMDKLKTVCLRIEEKQEAARCEAVKTEVDGAENTSCNVDSRKPSSKTTEEYARKNDSEIAKANMSALHKMQSLVQQMESQRQVLQTQREANETRKNRLELERIALQAERDALMDERETNAEVARKNQEQAAKLESELEAHRATVQKTQAEAKSLEEKSRALEVQSKINDAAMQKLAQEQTKIKADRAALMEETRAHAEVWSKMPAEVARITLLRKTHERSTSAELTKLKMQREALQAQHAVNETETVRLKAERETNAEVARKNQEQAAKLESELEAHRATVRKLEAEAKSLEEKSRALEAQRKINDAAMQKLAQEQTNIKADRAALMEERTANEKITLQNKAEAARLEIERKSLVQKEREINEKLERQRIAAKLDQHRQFYEQVLGKIRYKRLRHAVTSGTTTLDMYVKGNSIGEEGVKALVPALKSLSQLTTLDLGGNSIGEEGVKALVPALKSLSQLTTLDLGDKTFDLEGIETLKKYPENNLS